MLVRKTVVASCVFCLRIPVCSVYNSVHASTGFVSTKRIRMRVHLPTASIAMSVTPEGAISVDSATGHAGSPAWQSPGRKYTCRGLVSNVGTCKGACGREWELHVHADVCLSNVPHAYIHTHTYIYTYKSPWALPFRLGGAHIHVAVCMSQTGLNISILTLKRASL